MRESTYFQDAPSSLAEVYVKQDLSPDYDIGGIEEVVKINKELGNEIVDLAAR